MMFYGHGLLPIRVDSELRIDTWLDSKLTSQTHAKYLSSCPIAQGTKSQDMLLDVEPQDTLLSLISRVLKSQTDTLKRCPFYNGATMWKSFPNDIKENEAVVALKRAIKHHLAQKSVNNSQTT